MRINIATRGMHDPATAWRLISEQAARISGLRWHVQLFTSLPVLEALREKLRTLPAMLVVDHFGSPSIDANVGQPGFDALVELVRNGHAMVKLSAIERLCGKGRLHLIAPYIRALAASNPSALLWGSDWPHTGGGRDRKRSSNEIEPFERMDDAGALKMVAETLDDLRLLRQLLVDNPARLYWF